MREITLCLKEGTYKANIGKDHSSAACGFLIGYLFSMVIIYFIVKFAFDDAV